VSCPLGVLCPWGVLCPLGALANVRRIGSDSVAVGTGTKKGDWNGVMSSCLQLLIFCRLLVSFLVAADQLANGATAV
jgi:hypothetical protein